MLDSLLDGMKGQVAGALAEKAGINLGQAEQAVPLAGESIKEGIMGAVSGGNTADVMSMFSGLTGGGGGGALGAVAGLAGGSGGGIGGMMKNMVFAGIAKNFVGKLTSKLGIPSGIANTVSTMALPMIMNKIKGAASNDGGGIDAAGLMKVMGGGGAAGMLGGLMGGGDAGGAVDAAKDALGGLMGGGGADDAADAAKDAIKDKLGGLGGLLG